MDENQKKDEYFKIREIGPKSKYWEFECDERSELNGRNNEILDDGSYGKMKKYVNFQKITKRDFISTASWKFSINEKRYKNYVKFIYWNIKNKKVNGYIEYEKEITENYIKSTYGSDFKGIIVNKKERISPFGYKFQQVYKSKREIKESIDYEPSIINQ